MMHAYDKLYLEKARTSLGRMLDFAVYDLKYNASEFFALFIASGVAERFEQGDFTVLAGKSGIELAYLVLDEADVEYERLTPRFAAGRSEEYWTGWALAYYQWFTAMRFADIIKAVPLEEISALYTPYHEMDIRHFYEAMDEKMNRITGETKLKKIREAAGLSQNDLAVKSGVSLRSIQMYEQRNNDIDKAQAQTLYKISRVLGCSVEDLLETPMN